MDKKWSDWFERLEEMKKRNAINLPRVIAAKKKKFLKAICAEDQLEQNTVDVANDDENLHLYEVFDKVKSAPESVAFDDSIVVNDFMNIKRPEFDLKRYITCVKRLYSKKYVSSYDMCYLLCHARDFSAPRSHLYTFSDHGTLEIETRSQEFTLTLPYPCPFTTKLIALMDDLLLTYNERKYQQLNLNITFMILFMTRKIFKGKLNFKNALNNPRNHKDYVNLCPQPLSDRLPYDLPLLTNRIFIKGDTLFTLILYAYLNAGHRTRRVLVSTCIAHMEYTGLGLPKMFDKLLKLYNLPESHLWDLFCANKETYRSMFALADFHDMQQKGKDQVPHKTYILFPYCRALNKKYHHDLSSNVEKNYVTCYAMAYLIDKKMGMDTSNMRKAFWTQKLDRHWTMQGEEIAAYVYGKINQK